MSPASNRAVARAAASGYLRLLVAGLVQFAMVPVVIRHLGPAQYGLYALILSVLGFFAVLEFGAGAGAMKAAAVGWGTGNWEERNRALGVQMLISLFTAALALVLLLSLAPSFAVVFGVPAPERGVATAAVVLLGIRSAVLAWPLGVMRSALYGHGETVLVNAVQAAGAVLYGALSWLALHFGYGLVGFALANLAAFLVEHLGYGYLAWRRMPNLRLPLTGHDRAGIREGLSLGGSQLLVAVAGLILLRTDPIIIQAFLPLSAVGAYAVVLKVADQSLLITKQLVNALSPMIAARHAGRDDAAVRQIAFRGTRLALALALVVALPLALSADRLLLWWVGPEIAQAAPALAILVTAVALMAPQALASGLLTYTGRHQSTGRLAVQAVVINVVASLALVRPLGLTGVALGTLTAVLFVDIGLAGRALCRALGLPGRDYWQLALQPALAPALPALLVGLGLRAVLPVEGLLPLALLTTLVAGTYVAAALVWTLDPSERALVSARLRLVARPLPTGVSP